MTSDNHHPTDADILDQATEALRSSTIQPGPSPDLVATTFRGITDGLPKSRLSAQSAPANRRRTWRFIGYGAVAVTVLFSLVLWGLGGAKAVALDHALRNVQEANCVQFRVQVNFNGRPMQTSRGFCCGNRLRVDDLFGNGTSWIIDSDAKGALLVVPNQHIYQTVDMTEGGVFPIGIFGMDVRAGLLALKAQDAKPAKTEKINGEQADKYAIQGGKAFHMQGDWEIWVGRTSGLPVKVSLETREQGRPMIWVYDEFNWNPKLDAAIFSIDPPAGFEEKTILRLFPPLPPRQRD